jgi:long-chain acyl-CoA synthetase
MNIQIEFETGAAQWPNDIAIVHRGKRIRYGELDAAVKVLIAEFHRLGIEPGDKIGLLFPNGPEHIAATLAILGLGAVVVFLSPLSSAAEIAALAEEVALDAICFAERFGGYLSSCPGSATGEVNLFNGQDPVAVWQWPCSNEREERRSLVQINAAALRFSSGTTGKAKGIINSHDTILERAKVHFQSPPLKKDDAVLWMQPLGRLPGPLAYLLRGAKLVIGDALDTGMLEQLIRVEGVTHVYTVPLFFRTILNDEFAASGLGRVRYFLSGGTALGQQLADQFSAKFGHEIIEHYGLAESGTVFMNESQDPRKRGSIGLPVRTEVKLVSAAGLCLEGEATGELLVRCAGLFDAYYQPWRLREEILADGWFNTGDVARRDADGYYWIVGRVKEMINVAGVKVFPQDIESILASHDAVEEAVVFAAPNKRFGEVPHAKVKLRPGSNCSRKELLSYTNDRLPVFKSLRGLEFVESIPRTITGKVKRLA